ncbi:prohead core protein [Cronobacter phage vB_Cdu_VP8]|nr:prohead core protein [Cronobacter phage vB_Cdu_VP8]
MLSDYIEAIKTRDLVKAKRAFGAIMAEKNLSEIDQRRLDIARSIMIEGEEPEDDEDHDDADKGEKDTKKKDDESDDELDESADIKVGQFITLDPAAKNIPVSSRFKGKVKVTKVETVKFASGDELRYHFKDSDGFDSEIRAEFVKKA